MPTPTDRRPAGKPSPAAAPEAEPAPRGINRGAPVVGARLPLGEMLVAQGVITRAQLDEALEVQAGEGGNVGFNLKKLGYCTDADVLFALARQAGMDVVTLPDMEIPPDIIAKIQPPMLAETYRIIPFEFDEEANTLTVAMADPLNLHALDELRFMLNCNVKGAVSSENDIRAALAKYYGNNEAETFDGILQEMDEIGGLPAGVNDDEMDLANLESLANAAPVVKLLNLVLLSGIRDHAADLHFEPYEDSFRIRYRVDGALLELQSPPRSLAIPLAVRIKVMSSLNIAERRVPQDGKISLNLGGRSVDLRVSTLPTMFGESIVIRILDKSVVSLDINRLGMAEDVLNTFLELINKPNGVLLVTGPTGSGKTTTLYACLNAVNDTATKIITTEDPVEYELPGVIQCPIRPEIGVTYAACLRAILRQDPDKILVGEIRDVETAGIAIEAALTGHLVFSTLHTQDAPGTVARLVEMGVESYLLAATIEAVVAQRLIRCICPECKTSYKPSDAELLELGLDATDAGEHRFYYGQGCDVCKKTGYRGRNAIYEIMRLNSHLRDFIINKRSTEVLRQAAVESGMSTLRRSGLQKVFDGITTIDEIVRETAGGDE
ncbi:type IV fimbrial assembly protein PilB [Planctomycetales bacterium]|nr:type IV fimbrial assembly protein PilB [Planctomycetales bacterium]GHS96262.1 type IV fimbrial assembly protein PilB [Planctomycetales bacterium]GHT04995.1 type IV fimbrial assembly protein PilB [Planctomycetales bacterium]